LGLAIDRDDEAFDRTKWVVICDAGHMGTSMIPLGEGASTPGYGLRVSRRGPAAAVRRRWASRANRRYQSLGSGSPSASIVTTRSSVVASSREAASLNIAVPSSTSSNIAP